MEKVSKQIVPSHHRILEAGISRPTPLSSFRFNADDVVVVPPQLACVTFGLSLFDNPLAGRLEMENKYIFPPARPKDMGAWGVEKELICVRTASQHFHLERKMVSTQARITILETLYDERIIG